MAKRSCGKVMFSQMSACPQKVGISDPTFFHGVDISGARSVRGGGMFKGLGRPRRACTHRRHGT